MTSPQPEQWRTALAQANAARFAQAEVRRELADLRDRHASPTALIELLEVPTRAVAAQRLDRLLEAPYGFGRSAAATLMRKAGVHRHLRTGELTDRQRGVIVAEIRKRTGSSAGADHREQEGCLP